VVKPIVIRNSRWRCDHGWDIDLDDGSTNYHIYNNLMLSGGLKLREGFYRVVENNIMVNNTFHPHVWYVNSQDIFRRNIVFGPYRPIRVPKPWGAECNDNLLHMPGASEVKPATRLQEQSGRDEQSIVADAQFVDPAKGDYRVRETSPALKLGFQNFPMNQFGVQWPKLRVIALTPELPKPGEALSATLQSGRDPRPGAWLGAKVRNIVGMGDVSAAGLPAETGVVVLEVPPRTRAAVIGLTQGDVVVKLGDNPTSTLRDLQQLSADTKLRSNVQ
jgi:hypothetical protein